MASYGPIYEFAFDSQNGADILIVISKKNYTGKVTRRPLGRAPILKRENNENIYGTSLEIYAECKVDGEYAEFYTSSADEFKVDVYKNQSPLWTGFITPELYSEPDIAPPYDVQIIATDGLGELKSFTFATKGVSSIYDHLRSILDHVELARPLCLVSSLTYVDVDEQSDPVEFFSMRVDLEHEVGESCYDVLQRLLASFHAGITLHNGEWVIFRVTDFIHMTEGEWMQGVHSNGLSALFSIVDFGSMTDTDWWPIGQLSTSIEPAKKSLIVEAPNAYRANALSPEWDMENGASYNEDEKAYVLPDEGSNIMQTIDFGGSEVGYRLGLRIRAMNVGEGDEDQGIGIMLKIDAHTASGYADYYLLQNNATDRGAGSYYWDTREGWIEGELAVPTSSDTSNDAQDIDIIIPLYDNRRSGVNTRSWIYARSIEITIFNPQGTHDIHVYEVSLAKYEQSEGYQANVNINNAAREVGDTVTTSLSDASKVPVEGYLFQSGIPLFPDRDSAIRAWKIRNSDSKEYLQLMAEDYAMAVALPRMEYRGALNVPLRTIPFLFRREGTYYFPRTYSYDLINDELEVDLISIPAAGVTSSSVVVSQMTQSEGSFSSSGSGGGIGGGIDLSRYAKTEDVTELIDLLASMWSVDNAGNLVTEKQVVIKNNLIVDGDTASGGEGGSSSVGIQGIVVNGTTYRDTDGDGLIDLGKIGGGTLTEITYEMIVEALGYTPANSASLGSLAYKNGLTASDVGALSTSGGTITSNSYNVLRINSSYSEGGVAFSRLYIAHSDADKAFVGWDSDNGTILYNNSGKYLGIKNDGTPYYYSGGGAYNTLYHTGNFNPANYLPLSGGKLTGDIITKSFASGTDGLGLYIEGKSNVGIRIQYNKSETGKDYDTLLLKNGVISWNDNTLIHAGNVGDYKAGSANILASSYQENINYAAYTTHLKLIKSVSGDYATNGFPVQYVSGLSVMSGYTGWQMVTYGDPASDMRPYFRAVGGGGDWQAWKQLAFTDSTVDKAKKLVTDNNAAYAEFTDGTVYIGGETYSTANAVIMGNAINLRYGGGTNGLILNSSGNVTIGDGDLAGTDTKLYVNGYVAGGSFKANGRYALGDYFRIEFYNTAMPMIQTYNANLLLNPLSGNVLIGTTDDSGYRLKVEGTTYHSTELYLANWAYLASYKTDGSRLLMVGLDNSNLLTINERDSGVNTAILGGNVGIGTYDPYCLFEVASSYKDINPTSIAASAIFAVNRHKDDGLFIGHDYTKKGSWIQSAYYGTEANPSNTHTYQLFLNPIGGNVLIGTATAFDATTKLQVNGDIRLRYLYFNGNNIYSDTDGLYIQPYGAGNVSINQIGTSTIINPGGGNVLIGTTTDAGYKLYVAGTARIADAVKFAHTLSVEGAVTMASTLNVGGALTSSTGVLSKDYFKVTGTGASVSGLYTNARISSENYPKRLWLYNDDEVAIYGSEIQLRNNTTIKGNLVVQGDISA